MRAHIAADDHFFSFGELDISSADGVRHIFIEFSGVDAPDIVRFEKMYRTLLDETLAVLPNLKIMLMEPFVAHGVTTDAKADDFAKVKDYAKVVKKLAEEYRLSFLPLQEKFDELEAKYDPSYWTADGVHPTVMGAKMIANEWIKLFKAEIDK